MHTEEVERTCKLMGVAFDGGSKDICVDRLVMQYTFTLYGVEGPPASVLEAIVAAKAGVDGNPLSQTGPDAPTTKLDLLAAYDSDSEGEDGRKGSAAAQPDVSQQQVDATVVDVAPADEETRKKANQWESIEEEAEPQDGKSMSQWLIEKQVLHHHRMSVGGTMYHSS